MIANYTDVVLFFPLYVDGIHVTLLNFLKALEAPPPLSLLFFQKPTLSVVVNCGFIEPYQNDIAVRMLQLFAKGNGYPFGLICKIGSGEAILTTPFRILLKAKMKKFAGSVAKQKYTNIRVTMPLPQKMFIKASTTYWENYGKRNGVSKEQMQTMKIE